ncbi:MAG TPA: lysylphosphatidylglycerol synthase transmembrane domain-containing protein [Promineifilum sp.]|nr:lysylphosphatidylglycerol synthase transmembrane domain-containing protein [Promineifilum sp.]HQF70876.1 lysylphosphatidylglycerol synthase transmembrane domain-containing protein [Promineifilum sp.]
MITDKNTTTRPNWRRALPWLNLALSALLVLGGLWYLSTRVPLGDVLAALAGASPWWVALSVGVFVVTLLLKGWRWQLLFPAGGAQVSFRTAFWGLMLGQYVNLIIPFLRLGEVARLYALNRETGIAPARALGTLVVEKTLDLIFFGLTIVFILPFVILPDYVNRPGPWLLGLPAALLLVLYVLAFRTTWVIGMWRRIIRPLPERLSGWLLRVAVSGLEGLAALRDGRRSLLLLLASLLVAALSVLMPYTLFPALGLPLTLLDAALIHVVVSIAITPPSTPAKVGVFNAAVALMLVQLGLTDETAVAGYAILFYLVVLVPQIALGLVAASRSHWHWAAASQP